MSISTLQEKLFSKGCGSAFMVVAAIAMCAGIFGQCNRGQNGGQGSDEEGNPVATVAGIPVPGDRIQAVAGQRPTNSVTEQAFNLAQTTSAALRVAAIRALVAKEPPFTAAEIEKAAAIKADEFIQNGRMQLMFGGKIKPTASPAEVDKAFKDQTGKTPDETKKEMVALYQKAFADAASKAQVSIELAEPILAARLGQKAANDDAALRDSYRTYVVKRLFFSDQSGASESAEARAKKAEAALKSGTTFDKLMDTASNDPAPAGKAVHDATQELAADALTGSPDLTSLKGKAPFTTTPILDVPGGKAIYMLSAIRDNVPPDFEKNKAKYREVRAATAGRTDLQQRIDALLRSDVKWTSPGFQALAAAADPTKAGEAFDLAQKAAKSEVPAEKRLGALALLVATRAGDPNRVAALEAAQSAGIEDAGLSLDLAKAYGEKKDGAKATAALLAASKANMRYDAVGEGLFRDIAAAALDLQKKNVLTKDQLTQVQAQQAIWTAAHDENAKGLAEAKRQEAEAQKANAAEIARQKAEAAKNAAKSTGAAGGASVPGGISVVPTTTGGGSGAVPGTSTAPATPGSPTTGGPTTSGATTGGAGR